jgi:hypothetical protein
MSDVNEQKYIQCRTFIHACIKLVVKSLRPIHWSELYRSE